MRDRFNAEIKVKANNVRKMTLNHHLGSRDLSFVPFTSFPVYPYRRAALFFFFFEKWQ